MKLRSYGPALVAVVAFIAVYVYTRRERAPEPTAATSHESHAHGAREPHVAPSLPAAPPGAQPRPTTPGPTEPPKLRTAEELGLEEPKAKKPQMTLDEKLAETTKHIGVIERRGELLEREIAELERVGKQKEAAEQRIVLKRLREHADKLRADVAARREPE